MRVKDQTRRREQLVEAARAVLLERGATGVRVKDIADRAGLAPSSVLYYYPEIDKLLLEVARGAFSRYGERRAAAVREQPDAPSQLRLAIELGVPTGPDDAESRLLYELDALTGASAAFELVSTSYFDRQVHLYMTIIETGTARDELEPTAPAETIARGFVALEDGLGLQVVIGNPSVDAAEARRVLLSYAAAMTGTAFGEGAETPSPAPAP